MEKITYHKKGDYLVPNLCLKNSNENKYQLGKYGILRLNFIKKFKKSLYTELKMSNKLKNHLIDIDKQAKMRETTLIKKFANAENIPLYFKGDTSLIWTCTMNNIKNKAEEIILNELIYI